MQKKLWLARSWIVSRTRPIGDEEQPLKIQRQLLDFCYSKVFTSFVFDNDYFLYGYDGQRSVN